MADFFPCLKQQPQKRSEYFHKRKGFGRQIRSREICDKIRQKRIVGNDGPHIETMIKALPFSWQDTLLYMKQNPSYCEAIAKAIIDKVFPIELNEQQTGLKEHVYSLLPQSPPETLSEFIDQVYFFAILIEHQGIYSPNIFRRYLVILLEHGKSLKGLHLLFNLFIEVVKKPQLNWAPIEQIVETIRMIQKPQTQVQVHISQQEVLTYFHLVTNYYDLLQQSNEISYRIKLILQMGPNSFEHIKPSLYFRLCFQLTHFQNPNEQSQSINQFKKETRPNRFFHSAMINGGIVKAIYRHLFFSSKEKLKHLCLDVLNNLIIEYDGMILWAKQPSNPIQKFEQQIRDESNSMNLFKQYCNVFLTSILELPCNQIGTLFKKQQNPLDLILYILEKVDPDSHKGKQIHKRAQESLQFILNHGNNQIQQTVVEAVLDSRWKMVLGSESDLVLKCQDRRWLKL